MLSRRRRSEEEEEEGPALWMLTYGDMVTLLLVFFVFLSAYATMDVHRFREIIMSYRGTLGLLPSGVGIFEPGDLPQSGPDSGEPAPAQSLNQAVPELFEKKGQKEIEETGGGDKGGETESSRETRGGAKRTEKSSEIYTYLTEYGRVVMIPDVVEFEKGSDVITQNFKDFLIKLEPLFEFYSEEEILVVGHADEIKYSSLASGYPTNNWELASARAVAVVKFLTKELKIPNDRFAVQSSGEYKRGQRLVDIIFRTKPEYKGKSVGFE